MKEFRNILLAVRDPQEEQPLIRRGLKIANDLEAALTVMVVLEDPPKLLTMMMQKQHEIDMHQRMVEETERQIARAYEGSGLDSAEIGTEVTFGSPLVSIIRHVLRCQYDLLLTGGASNPRARFGNTVLRLLRKCPCPVWVLDVSKDTAAVAKVLATINDRHDDEVVEKMNHSVLKLAVSIAKDEGAELHILQAWRHFGEELQRGHWGLPATEVDEIDLQLKQKSEESLAKCLNAHDLGGFPHHVHLIKADAASIIPDFVAEHSIDLTVMGTICRTGVPGLLIGNTAEKVLRRINCSVLAVKPDGFRSPVTLD